MHFELQYVIFIWAKKKKKIIIIILRIHFVVINCELQTRLVE